MTDNLKQKTISALLWSFVDRFGQQVLYLLSGMVLARIILPEEYGKIAVLTIFIAIANILSDGGMAGALFKKRTPTKQDYDTVFFFNIIIACILYLVVFLAAPWIAQFFKEPDLASLLRVLQLSSIVTAFGFIQQTQLSKAINMKALSKVNIAALFLASAVAIVMALYGFKAWALVAQTLGMAVFRTIILWLFGKWRPTWVFNFSSLKEFWGFSAKMMMVSLLNSVSNNIYSLFIKKNYSFTLAGFYAQAYKYQDIPSLLISGTFHTVTLPVLASVNHDKERMERIFRKNIKSMAFVIFPVMFLLSIVAKPLIVLLLSDVWLPSAPMFQVLCVAGAFLSFTVIACDVFIATGRSDWYLTYEIIRKLMLFGGIFCCYSYGIMALCYLWLAYSVLSLLLSLVFTGKMITYGLRKFITDSGVYLLLALLLSGAVYLWCFAIDNMYVLGMVQVGSFALAYLAVCKWLHVDEIKELMLLVKNNDD